jgi:hypothetical protein
MAIACVTDAVKTPRRAVTVSKANVAADSSERNPPSTFVPVRQFYRPTISIFWQFHRQLAASNVNHSGGSANSSATRVDTVYAVGGGVRQAYGR